MKLRTQAAIFFGLFLFVITLGIFLYTQYVIGGVFKKQTTDNFRIIAEQTESTYLVFREVIKTRTLDWSSDIKIQSIAKAILAASEGSPDRTRLAKEFTTYLNEKKMPYDKTIFLVDLINRNGIIFASTKPERIGRDENIEKTSIGNKTHNFDEVTNSKFGEAFVSGVVIEDRESPVPFIHSSVLLFSEDKTGEFVPLDAILLIHFANLSQAAEALGASSNNETVRLTTGLFLKSYETSDVYLVNSERTMVTPSRYVQDITQRQKVDTFPVRECLNNGREIHGEYDNYQGVRVIGSSMCFQKERDVIIVEVQKDEIFSTMTALARGTAVASVAVFVLGIFIIFFFVRRPLARISEVVTALNCAIKGDLTIRTPVSGKDETADLARAFNIMIETVQASQEKLNVANEKIKKEASLLERDVKVHEQQEKFLDQSRRAQVNLLEDAWQAKERLEVEKNRLQTILSSIGDGLLIIDGAYRVVLINPVAATMFGMAREEINGKDLRTIITFWKKRKEVIPPALWPFEEVFLTKKTIEVTLDDDFSISTENHTEKIPIVFSVAPLDGVVAGAVVVIRDATKDRELDDAKSGFISVASHQLRTPLTTIRWYAEMLLSGDAGELSASQRDFLTEVHGGAERLYQTVDLLLGISRVESGKIKTIKTPIDLDVFTGEIAKELAPQIDEKKLVLNIISGDMGPVVVSQDSLTLRQVVLNLISNAIRYSNENGTIEIKWSVDNEKKEVVYMVRDNGIGIPENQRPRIFSKFFRAENARAWAPDGSGLGLALVKDLVESWGGKVWFEGTEGQGTTFFFTVPL